MKIIKTKQVYVCKICLKKIEGELKVKNYGLRRARYYHLNCYFDILNNTVRALENDKKRVWEELRQFNKLKKEMEEEKKIMKKQEILENLK